MTSTFSEELRGLEELEREDELRAAVAAPTFDVLHELQISFTQLALALRVRAASGRGTDKGEET